MARRSSEEWGSMSRHPSMRSTFRRWENELAEEDLDIHWSEAVRLATGRFEDGQQ